ncbi:C-type lectin domain family 17, member A-like [Hemitrygon akajei]|uniref:C-type lectin domain family 17, member A-like n=1 Tax=Hemitrygon akajei TaxID=2704970 RepID=UPI003BFA142B
MQIILPTLTCRKDGMDSERPKRRDRSDSSIWLICVLTATLIITGICWRIHVSQIRQSYETCHRNANHSVLKRMHSDLRHQFTEMETKYRSVNETKAQICELLTSRREQTCSKDWLTNKDRCYYVSTFHTSFQKAKQECSNRDSRLLEINSRDEARFVSHNLPDNNLVYWIEKCENGNVGRNLLYKASPGNPECIQCGTSNTCDGDRNFICERSAPLFPDVPEKILGLCQQPVEST